MRACRDVFLGLFAKTTLLYALLFFAANLTVSSLSDDKIQALLKVIVCPLTKSPLKFDRNRCVCVSRVCDHVLIPRTAVPPHIYHILVHIDAD